MSNKIKSNQINTLIDEKTYNKLLTLKQSLKDKENKNNKKKKK